MKVVVDSNIIFSALISCKTTYLEIFELAEVYVPDYLLIEVSKYEARINRQNKLASALKVFTQALFSQITVIPNLAIDSRSFLKAHSLCKDIDLKDIPFVALSIDLSVPLWTDDKALSNGLKAKGYSNVVSSTEIFNLVS